MKNQIRIACIFLFVCIIGVLLTSLISQDVVGPNSRLAWDPVTTNTDGTPALDIAGYEVVMSLQGADLANPTNRLASTTVTDTTIPLTMHLNIASNQPPQTYEMAVRAFDSNGNQSDWSRLLVVFDSGKPIAPGNPRIVRTNPPSEEPSTNTPPQ